VHLFVYPLLILLLLVASIMIIRMLYK